MSATTSHNSEAERALLGAMFIARDDERAAIFGTVRRSWFYIESHCLIWDALLAIERAGQPIDAVSVVTTLRDLGTLENAGGGSNISQLPTHSPTAVNWEFYARAIKEEARRRALSVHAAAALAGFEGDAPIQAAGELVTKVNQVLADAEAQTVYTSYDAAHATLDMLQEAERRREAGEVVQWRMSPKELGDAIPLMPGKMIVLGMRSGGGKTSAAANGAMMTSGAGEGFGFHSVEMPVDEVNLRLMSRVVDINELDCLRGVLKPSIAGISQYLGPSGASRNPLFITKPTRSIDDLERKVRHLYAVHGVRYHAIDYFQLLRSPQRFASRADELNDIGQRLKQLTSDLPGCAVLVLAQLNKHWSGSTPRKEDIRFGSGLCDSADGVTLGYRPNRSVDDDGNGPATPDDRIIFINDKGRFGGEHTAAFGWFSGRIVDRDRTYAEEMQHRLELTRRKG